MLTQLDQLINQMAEPVRPVCPSIEMKSEDSPF